MTNSKFELTDERLRPELLAFTAMCEARIATWDPVAS